MEIICRKCKERKEYYAKGFCRKCYLIIKYENKKAEFERLKAEAGE